MTFNLGIARRGILQRGDIRQDQRVSSVLRRHINRPLPATHAIRMGKGVDRDMQFATMLMKITRGFSQFFIGEIQTRKMTGIGVIFQPHIHRISAILYSGAHCG